MMTMTSIKFGITYNEFMGMELHFVTGMKDSYVRLMEEAKKQQEENSMF